MSSHRLWPHTFFLRPSIFLLANMFGRYDMQGMPDWDALVSELPVLDSLISKLER